jgi:hypothetical protein
VPESRLFEVEIGIVKLRSCKSCGTDQIEWVKYYVVRYTHLFVLYVIRRNFQSSGGHVLLYQFIKMVIRLIVFVVEGSPSYELPTKFYPSFFWPS